MDSSSPTVHTLLCSSHVSFGIPCLRSFQERSGQRFHLVIHDDGSLTSQDVDRLSEIPSSSVLTSAAADDLVSQFQSKYPHLLAARKFLPHIRKLLDINVYPESDQLTRFVDSDVFFFRRFEELFPIAVPPGDSAAFSIDSNSSFGCRVKDFKPLGPVKLRAKLNSGLFWIKRSLVDLDRFESLCERWGADRIRTYGGWFEQMLWSDLAYRVGARMLDPTQIATASENFVRKPEHVAVHYVTPSRQLLHQYLDDPQTISPGGDTSTSTIVRTIPGQTFGIIAAVRSALRFKLQLLLKKSK